MFPWKDFLMGWTRKIQKHEARDRSGKKKKKKKKQEGRSGGKKKKRF